MKRVERFGSRVVVLIALTFVAGACAATSGTEYGSRASYDTPASYDASAQYGSQSSSSEPVQYASPSPYGAPPLQSARRPMPAAQGWIGIGNMEQRNVDIDSSGDRVADVDDATTPVIGGVFMQPLGGDRLAYGLEGGLSFAWDGNIEAVVVGSGGIAVAGSTDVFVGDLFGGPFVSFDLTPKVRIYGSTGLGLQWASYDLGYDTPSGHQHLNGDAFGGEWYVRTGIEFRMSPATWIGLGLRYVDSSIDPGGGVGNVDLHQEQILFTVTNGF